MLERAECTWSLRRSTAKAVLVQTLRNLYRRFVQGDLSDRRNEVRAMWDRSGIVSRIVKSKLFIIFGPAFFAGPDDDQECSSGWTDDGEAKSSSSRSPRPTWSPHENISGQNFRPIWTLAFEGIRMHLESSPAWQFGWAFSLDAFTECSDCFTGRHL